MHGHNRLVHFYGYVYLDCHFVSKDVTFIRFSHSISEESFYEELKSHLQETEAAFGSDFTDEEPSWLPSAQKRLDDVVFQN